MPALIDLLTQITSGTRLSDDDARSLAGETNLPPLLEAASALRDSTHANVVSYSRKVFIPLTQLCRDVCHYCTFAQAPQGDVPAYLTREQVLEIARAGAAAGCNEDFSHWVTNPSSATRQPAKDWRPSATRPPSTTSLRCLVRCSRKQVCYLMRILE